MAETACGWVYLFHPAAGSKPVTLPVPALAEDGLAVDAQGAFMAVEAYLAAGFLASDPSLTPGQERRDAAFVVRRSKVNEAGEEEAAMIDWYADHDKAIHKIFTQYLNSADDVREWERQTGLRLDLLSINEAETAITKEARTWRKLAVSLPHTVGLILKPNPRYEGPEDKKHASRLFVGYVNQSTGEITPSHKELTKAQVQTVKEEAGRLGMSREDIGQALGIVSNWGEFHGTVEEALAKIRNHARPQATEGQSDPLDDIPF